MNEQGLPLITDLLFKDRSCSIDKHELSTAGESSHLLSYRLPRINHNQSFQKLDRSDSHRLRLVRREQFHQMTEDLRVKEGLQNQNSLFGQMKSAFKCLTSL
jgi:hypothetical protein